MPEKICMRVVFVTCPPGKSVELLKTLVQERLVACGNIVPHVRSVYWWKDEICDDAEEIIWMETATDRIDAMMRRLKEIHPYEVPKILTFDPKEGLPDYLAWVNAETRPR
jgi:periplasmic divalent cation tolerance protein